MVDELRNILRDFYPLSKTNIHRRKTKKKFKELLAKNKNKPLKIVIGSGQRFTDGWVPTEQHFLDLLKLKTWLKYFKKNGVDCLLAEHVWEHLTLEQGKVAAETCYTFLKNGGHLRVAVPDGLHTDSNYIEYVKPGGHGAGADDHKVLYNYKSFSTLFSEIGFNVKPLEYFDENGVFHANPWDLNDGYIHRSILYDERNQDGKPNYTSLILDAIKL